MAISSETIKEVANVQEIFDKFSKLFTQAVFQSTIYCLLPVHYPETPKAKQTCGVIFYEALCTVPKY